MARDVRASQQHKLGPAILGAEAASRQKMPPTIYPVAADQACAIRLTGAAGGKADTNGAGTQRTHSTFWTINRPTTRAFETRRTTLPISFRSMTYKKRTKSGSQQLWREWAVERAKWPPTAKPVNRFGAKSPPILGFRGPRRGESCSLKA